MGDPIGMQITGLDTLTSALNGLGGRAPAAMAQALNLEAEGIMAASKPLVPFDIGDLRGSGVVLPPEVSGTQVSVTMGYGGPASAYALIQHEDLTFHHTEGQAKYLEQPALEAASGMADRIRAVLERELFNGAT